jgi:hypothetical protein
MWDGATPPVSLCNDDMRYLLVVYFQASQPAYMHGHSLTIACHSLAVRSAGSKAKTLHISLKRDTPSE